MEMRDFTLPSGHLRPIVAPNGSSALAFAPDKLPPSVEKAAIGNLAARLAEANHALGQLDGIGIFLPNPDLLVRPYIRREAVLSSKIEGTHTSFNELVSFEAEPSTVSPDGREVLNYVVALDYGLRHVLDEGITADLVRTIHRQLLQGVRGSNFSTPGEFRAVQNHIGQTNDIREAHFVPPKPEDAQAALDAFFAYLHRSPDDVPFLVEAAWVHYQFEVIHPFLDGNGRVGRVLIPLLLAWRRKLTHPLLYLSPYFESRRSEYYDRLFAVSARSDWEGWLRYFLEGVREQALQGITLAHAIIAMGQIWHARLNSVSAPLNAHRAADLVHQHIAVTPKLIELMLGVAPQTAYNAIEVLVSAGILQPIRPGARRFQSYRAGELAELFRSPPPIN